MSEQESTRTVNLDERERDLRAQALNRIKRRSNFRTHVVAYVLGNVVLAIVWATTEYQNAGGWPTGFRTGRMNHDWDPWIIYPLIAGTRALAVHAWIAFARGPVSDREIADEIDRLRRGRVHA